MVLQLLAQARGESAAGRLPGQQLVDPTQGQEQLGARGGELAVAQHRQLGVVQPAEVEGFGEGRQHPVAPAVAAVPEPDQVGKGDPASSDVIPVTHAVAPSIDIDR